MNTINLASIPTRKEAEVALKEAGITGPALTRLLIESGRYRHELRVTVAKRHLMECAASMVDNGTPESSARMVAVFLGVLDGCDDRFRIPQLRDLRPDSTYVGSSSSPADAGGAAYAVAIEQAVCELLSEFPSIKKMYVFSGNDDFVLSSQPADERAAVSVRVSLDTLDAYGLLPWAKELAAEAMREDAGLPAATPAFSWRSYGSTHKSKYAFRIYLASKTTLTCHFGDLANWDDVPTAWSGLFNSISAKIERQYGTAKNAEDTDEFGTSPVLNLPVVCEQVLVRVASPLRGSIKTIFKCPSDPTATLTVRQVLGSGGSHAAKTAILLGVLPEDILAKTGVLWARRLFEMLDHKSDKMRQAISLQQSFLNGEADDVSVGEAINDALMEPLQDQWNSVSDGPTEQDNDLLPWVAGLIDADGTWMMQSLINLIAHGTAPWVSKAVREGLSGHLLDDLIKVIKEA